MTRCPMTLKTALGTVLIWTAVFACLGAAVGATLGTVAPGYYRAVFRGGNSPEFQPLAVGVGLGTIQGIGVGVVLSIIVIALFAWRDVRSARYAAVGDASPAAPRLRRWSVHALWAVVTALSLVMVGGVAFVLGGIIGQEQLYHSWAEQKLEKIEAVFDTGEFPNVEVIELDAAYVFLRGTVADKSAHDSLHEKLVTAFGTEQADQMIRHVEVAL